MLFVRRQARAGAEIVDPLAGRLAELAAASAPPEALAGNMLSLRQVFPAALASDARFEAALTAAIRAGPASWFGEIYA
jgi:mannitol-1-phosphate/altronate dehydrogenase